MENTINPIEAVQSIISTMKDLETRYFEAYKGVNTLNEKQNDLLHTLELDISEEEALAVTKALQELRKERRELKDTLSHLSEAKDFVGANYKFMSEGHELIKKMQRTEEKISTQKYFVRHCEAIKEVLDISKYTERMVINESAKQEVEEKAEEPKLSPAEKFNKKWFPQK